MSYLKLRAVSIAILFSVVAAMLGCQGQSDATNRDNARYANPTPEESFELIVQTFRRGIEDVHIGFLLPDEDGHSMMTGRNEVQSELIPPAKENEPYKGIITVGSQSRYSMKRTTSEDENAQTSDQRSKSLLDEEDPDDLQVFDRELVSKSGGSEQDRRASTSSSEKKDEVVTRKADRQERKYELLYEQGKWKLTTTLDPETEQSIQNAFNHALAMQI